MADLKELLEKFDKAQSDDELECVFAESALYATDDFTFSESAMAVSVTPETARILLEINEYIMSVGHRLTSMNIGFPPGIDVSLLDRNKFEEEPTGQIEGMSFKEMEEEFQPENDMAGYPFIELDGEYIRFKYEEKFSDQCAWITKSNEEIEELLKVAAEKKKNNEFSPKG